MSVPDARVKDLPKDRKYELDHGGSGLSEVNGIGITLDENSNINSRMISGEERNTVGIEANDRTTADQLAAELGGNRSAEKFTSAGQLQPTARQRKLNTWNKTNARQQEYGQQVSSTVDQMYRNPTLGQTEKAEQVRVARDEEQRLRANEKLLELLDKQIQQQDQPYRAKDPIPTNKSGKLDNGEKEDQREVLKLQPHIKQLVTSSDQEFGNSFYGLNGRKTRNNRPTKDTGSHKSGSTW